MEALLARMKDAVQAQAWLDHDGQWLLTGHEEGSGVEGPLSLHMTHDGPFRRTFDSPLGTTEAFDGDRGWQTDVTGMPSPLELSNLAQAKLDVWVSTGLWLANPSLLEVVSTSDSPHQNEVTVELRVPGSPLVASLIVDRETALPLRLEIPGVVQSVREFVDFQDMGGVRLPSQVLRTVSGLVDSRRHFQQLTTNATVAKNPQPAVPDDCHFEAPSGDVPLHFAPTGHLLVRPSINGIQTDAFIFDTGAGQSGVAANPPAQLGLEPVGKGIISSIFGVVETPVLRGAPLQLGPLVLHDPTLATIDMDPLTEVFGEPVGGIIGFDVLRRSIVELDLAQGTMRLHDPQRYELPDAKWLPLRFQDNHPIVPATFEGHTGLFRIDVGASGGPHGNVAFHAPTVKQLKLAEGRETQQAQLGNQTVAIGAIESFEMGGVSFGPQDVVFALDDEGIFADPSTMGNIGVGILGRFTMVFDYSRERIALMPKT